MNLRDLRDLGDLGDFFVFIYKLFHVASPNYKDIVICITMYGCVAAIMYELCRGKQKLELDLSHGKPAMLTNVSVPAHNDQRLETVNLQYESFDGPQAIDTDDYVIAALDTDGNQFSSESSEAAVTSKNNPIIEDNPAYSTSSSGPPLTDNPAYSVI